MLAGAAIIHNDTVSAVAALYYYPKEIESRRRTLAIEDFPRANGTVPARRVP